ncbi:MAG: hypothetical protein II922_02350 [Succinimonas sp.]|jgi:hypothetical protein|nr:hypothetical protein [Succinimonas sp.]MEE3421663.1 YqiA/YcfP family alpha/beta fold hydrolase [Succinimonas sp.]
MSKDTVVYIHGFLSGAKSEKAVLTEKYLKENCPGADFFTENFPNTPKEAYDAVDALIGRLIAEDRRVALIGSSMGGFYSICMSRKYNVRAALINPCVFPWKLMPAMLGPHVNPYTGVKFEVTEEYIETVKKLGELAEPRPEKLALYLCRGDEVLNAAESAAYLGNAALVHIEDGGNHRFPSFAACLPEIISFLLKKE